MPVDAEAAGKNEVQNKDGRFDLGSLSDTPGQRMKDLVNLDAFKNSISNICQLWLGGIPAPPRRYEHWRSKLVQQEKITFVESAATDTANTVVASTTGSSSAPPSQHLFSTQSTSHDARSSSIKITSTEGSSSNSRPEPSKSKKRKEPHVLLEDIYKHTYDPLPE